MKTEQKFMMIFRYIPNPDYRPTPQEIEQMRQDWGSFIGNIAIKEKLESTYQLGFDGKQINSDLSIKEGVLISEEKMISGNMIVKANSLDEAVAMAKDSPILKMGGTVEVRNIIPMKN
ncbi:YciI family protein [Croceitalea rosinachiae]|uniref:YciI family protein n=1 Tax=Croceitalea rosinachiae TaxID=3075596 RepID=A0ABU3AED9_9FLAO|nr:YciI family protein [Croceitalea sp. F388]MDT0608165.1 YciI family protein [Croceitalea sp. F388]